VGDFTDDPTQTRTRPLKKWHTMIDGGIRERKRKRETEKQREEPQKRLSCTIQVSFPMNGSLSQGNYKLF
jgi:hypothetical protein